MIYQEVVLHTQSRLESLRDLPPEARQRFKEHLEALRNSTIAVLEKDFVEESYEGVQSSTPKAFEPKFEGGLFLDFQEPLPIRFSEPSGPDQFVGSRTLLEALWVFRDRERCRDSGCDKEHPYLILNFYLNGGLRIGLKINDESFPHFTFETPFHGCCPAHAKVCPTELVKPHCPEETPSLCGVDMEAEGHSRLRHAAPSPCPTAISCEILMRFALRLLDDLRDQRRLPI